MSLKRVATFGQCHFGLVDVLDSGLFNVFAPIGIRSVASAIALRNVLNEAIAFYESNNEKWGLSPTSVNMLTGEVSQEAPTSAFPKPTCKACSHYGWEPDADFPICFHPDSGTIGIYVKKEPVAHCADFSKFEQHPLRTISGGAKNPLKE